MEPMHLGDGAYVQFDANSNQVVLTANAHLGGGETDRVFLDLRALKALERWIKAFHQGPCGCKYASAFDCAEKRTLDRIPCSCACHRISERRTPA